jgi:hypothetical protein
MKFRTLLLATTAAAVCLVGPLASAQAHHNNVGSFVAGVARCDRTQIFVHQPVIGQAQPLPIIGGGQTVAFKSHLAQFVPNVGWKTVASGIWKKTQVNDYGVTGSWTTEKGEPTTGSMYFYNLSTGTNANPVLYRVFTEYYWYADQTRHSGYTSAWNPHQEGRTHYGDQSTYPYCKYPGPYTIG